MTDTGEICFCNACKMYSTTNKEKPKSDLCGLWFIYVVTISTGGVIKCRIYKGMNYELERLFTS